MNGLFVVSGALMDSNDTSSMNGLSSIVAPIANNKV